MSTAVSLDDSPAWVDWVVDPPERGSPLPTRPTTPEPTVEIVRRICAGDGRAREALVRRYLPSLRRWSRGRLPAEARGLCDTDDLVQVAMLRALNNIDQLRLANAGSFFLYLKQSVLNGVRDEIRRCNRTAMRDQTAGAGTSESNDRHPDVAVAYSDLEAYERALQCLPRRQQQLVVMRLEFGLSYEEIARECSTSADAARMMVTRAVVQLAQQSKQAT